MVESIHRLCREADRRAHILPTTEFPELPGFDIFTVSPPQKNFEKLRPHPLQQTAEMNERSQIWSPLRAAQGLGSISS
ncbi:MAG: hypothetical protein ACI88A_005041 [Paraglaciecola sp.]